MKNKIIPSLKFVKRAMNVNLRFEITSQKGDLDKTTTNKSTTTFLFSTNTSSKYVLRLLVHLEFDVKARTQF